MSREAKSEGWDAAINEYADALGFEAFQAAVMSNPYLPHPMRLCHNRAPHARHDFTHRYIGGTLLESGWEPYPATCPGRDSHATD